MTTTIDGITCPSCGATTRNVIESRRIPDRVRRRCVCGGCGERFTTWELRYDMISARLDALAAKRATRLLDRFQAMESAMATLRLQLEEEVNITSVMSAATVEPVTCRQCTHWEADHCGLGFPDPAEEGIEFAQWCASFRRAG